MARDRLHPELQPVVVEDGDGVAQPLFGSEPRVPRNVGVGFNGATSEVIVRALNLVLELIYVE